MWICIIINWLIGCSLGRCKRRKSKKVPIPSQWFAPFSKLDNVAKVIDVSSRTISLSSERLRREASMWICEMPTKTIQWRTGTKKNSWKWSKRNMERKNECPPLILYVSLSVCDSLWFLHCRPLINAWISPIGLQIFLGCCWKIKIRLVLGMSKRRKMYLSSCIAERIHSEKR